MLFFLLDCVCVRVVSVFRLVIASFIHVLCGKHTAVSVTRWTDVTSTPLHIFFSVIPSFSPGIVRMFVFPRDPPVLRNSAPVRHRAPPESCLFATSHHHHHPPVPPLSTLSPNLPTLGAGWGGGAFRERLNWMVNSGVIYSVIH